MKIVSSAEQTGQGSSLQVHQEIVAEFQQAAATWFH